MGIKIGSKSGGESKTLKTGKVGTDYSSHLGESKVSVKAKQAVASTEVIKTNNLSKQSITVVDEHEQVGKPTMIPADQMAVVSVGGGQTVNLGDFNSVKYNVGISVPSHINDIDETFEFASNWVSNRMAEIMKEIKG